ncbi:MAG: RDD family protein [Firmicutes bacterium]|nr:RDD family protein [Bacillota bacterium]
MTGKVEDNLYKTLGERIMAFIFDVILLEFVRLIFSFIFCNNGIRYIFGALFDPILFFIYRVSMHVIYGQTIGKKIWHIKVVDIETLKILKFHQVILREMILFLGILFNNSLKRLSIEQFYHHNYNDWFISGLEIGATLFLVLLIIDFIVMITNKRKRALHDYIAKSVIVDLGILEPINLKRISLK